VEGVEGLCCSSVLAEFGVQAVEKGHTAENVPALQVGGLSAAQDVAED